MSQPAKDQASLASSVALALVVLLVGFGDGLATGIQRRLNLPSPWVVLVPVAFLVLLAYHVRSGRRLPETATRRSMAVAWVMALGLLLQLVFFHGMNVAGYVQLALFVLLLIVIKADFAGGDAGLRSRLGPALLIAYLFLCSYLVVAWIIWQFTGVDVSVVALLSGRGVAAYYGYRPAGWSVEPAWASFAVSVGFAGVYLLVPRARPIAFFAMALAAIALQSATLVLFMASVAVALVFRRRAPLLLVPMVVVVLLAVTIANPILPRIEAIVFGYDPSTQMRVASVGVAWDVVAQSFPVGVGYGNFRDVAVYGQQFSSLVDLQTYQFYKSDLVVLNLVAELGIAGLVLLAFVYRMLGFGSFLLPTIILAMQAVLSGTILMPALLVLAAVVGTLQYSRTTEQRVPCGAPNRHSWDDRRNVSQTL